MTPSMTCAEAEPLLPLVADGAVDPSSDPDLFAHLASCPACQRAVAAHDLITLALERGAVRRPRARIITLPRLAAAATLVLALGATAWAVQSRNGDPLPAASPVVTHQPAARPSPATPPATPASTVAEAPAVLRVQRTDGSTLFLVRRGDTWMPVDPGQFDGSDTRSPAGGEDVPVRW